MNRQRKLLVLDVDETLVHTSLKLLDHAPDFVLFDGKYFVYRRPHLESFLVTCAASYDLAVWSAASGDYVALVLENILPPGIKLDFVWSGERCTRKYDIYGDTGMYGVPEQYSVKSLKKLKKSKGYDLAHVLIVDNDHRTAERNYGNLVHVRDFEGAADDNELQLLAPYLTGLAGCDNFRRVEKRFWRPSGS